MSRWTKELPKADGIYWYRRTPTSYPEPVEWTGGGVQAAERIGLECPYFLGSEVFPIDGEFWSERLIPPP